MMKKEELASFVYRGCCFYILLSIYGVAQASNRNDMFGVWGGVTLQGDFKDLADHGDKVHWLIMNQTRTREDSPAGSRFTENLLFSQVGYQFNKNMSAWLGYTHDWIKPLNHSSIQENRPYMDWLWNDSLMENFKWMARTRMEARINQETGDDGYRARQLLQLNYALPQVKGLSLYVGDEVFFYLNANNFGKKGFTENRIFTGLSYQFNEPLSVDLGYMGQYIDTKQGDNLMTNNLQVNFRYHF